eukprot:23499-Pelagomonas_calceolata.AAC.1
MAPAASVRALLPVITPSNTCVCTLLPVITPSNTCACALLPVITPAYKRGVKGGERANGQLQA